MPGPLCVRGAGSDTMRKYDEEDPESASAAACCAAALNASPAGCKAWQLISESEGALPACWLMATIAQRSGAAGESCTSAALVAPPPAARTNRTSFSGIWVQHGSLDDLVHKTFVVGGDIPIKWGEVEIADDQWDWSATDAAFSSAAANGFWIETSLEVGPAAPTWIYTEAGGVPPVNITPGVGHNLQPEIFPDYLDLTYQRYFLRAVDRFAAHIASLPTAVRSKIVASQAMFGSTGDDCPWHGSPVAAPATKEKKWGLFTDAGKCDPSTSTVPERFSALMLPWSDFRVLVITSQRGTTLRCRSRRQSAQATVPSTCRSCGTPTSRAWISWWGSAPAVTSRREW